LVVLRTTAGLPSLSSPRMTFDDGCIALNNCSGRGLCRDGAAIAKPSELPGSAVNYGMAICLCESHWRGDDCSVRTCVNDCSGRGICVTAKQLAAAAGKKYSDPWDAQKQQGCICDVGSRGPDCSLRECPSDSDIMGGDGATQGRDGRLREGCCIFRTYPRRAASSSFIAYLRSYHRQQGRQYTRLY
jgi:hypothetical protein